MVLLSVATHLARAVLFAFASLQVASQLLVLHTFQHLLNFPATFQYYDVISCHLLCIAMISLNRCLSWDLFLSSNSKIAK